MNRKTGHWTNASVRKLAGEADPVLTIVEKARQVVYRALETGWGGPPFEPLALAEHLGLQVVPRDDVRDARTLPAGRNGFRLEYNPNRPLHRVRYSIAHEIAHTLFPDCSELVRNRTAYHEAPGDSWQIEALCNIAAAELLMPAASLANMNVANTTIDDLMELRKTYGVSAEALLIRLTELTDQACLMFCASAPSIGPRYRIDYAIASLTWSRTIPTGVVVSGDSAVSQCTAIGFTARATEIWPHLQEVHVECVGIPPYPGTTVPRVVGFAVPSGTHSTSRALLTYVTGDATRPRGAEPLIIAQVVNDATPNWGGAGFATALRQKWPGVQSDFADWARKKNNLSLGNVHFTAADDRITVASIVAQRGYGESKLPRIRYGALRNGLLEIAKLASLNGLAVHIPRIGTGQAGGVWDVVADLIKETLCARGVSVLVYSLPNSKVRQASQAHLPLFS